MGSGPERCVAWDEDEVEDEVEDEGTESEIVRTLLNKCFCKG